jgi:3-hydroxyacyl-[acyl-carrier-protein] dehydratase
MNDQPAAAAIGPLDIKRVMAALPHRYPMLLVDRVESLDPEKGIVAIKAVSMNEEFFQGHFPGNPVMPGVLIIEAMAQVAGVGLLGVVPEDQRKLLYLTGVDRCKFRRPVVPGDQLRIEAEIVSVKTRLCKCRARATVEGALCAEAELMSALVERK